MSIAVTLFFGWVAGWLLGNWNASVWYERTLEQWFGILDRGTAGEGERMRSGWRRWKGEDVHE